jgi:hypothetical protein
MARLTATNGVVVLAAGALATIPASAFTIAALFRRSGTTTDGFETLLVLDAAVNGTIITNIGADAGSSPYVVQFGQGGTTATFGFSDLVDDTDYLFVVRKTDGDVTPRANLYQFGPGAAWRGWADGSTTVENRADTIVEARILNQPGGFPWNGGIYVAAVWDGALAEADITNVTTGLHIGVQQWLDSNPVALWRPGETDPVQDESAAGTSDETSSSGVTITAGDPADFDMQFGADTITGTLAATLPALTGEFDGALGVAGAVAATLPAVTSDLNGEISATTGNLTVVLPALTTALVGVVGVAGDVDAVLPVITAALAGETTVAGQLDAQLPALVGDFDGGIGIAGSITATLPALTSQFNGAVLAAGVLDVTLPSIVADLTGAVGATVGVLAATLPALDADLVGTVEATTAILTVTLPSITSELDGALATTGVLGVTLPGLTAELDGVLGADGQLDAMLPALQFTGTGTIDAGPGLVVIVLPALTSALTGQVAADGPLDTTLPAITSQFSGTVEQEATGQLDVTLPSLSAALIGTSEALPPAPGVDLMTLAFAIVTGVGECVREELAETDAGVPDRFCLIVPGEIAWDECECGQFAQSITTEVPSENFPFPATDRRSTACGPQFLVVTVVASLTRCVPTFDRNNKPPSCDALFAAALRLEEDRTALRRGVTCCLRGMRNTYTSPIRITDFTVGAATSVGPNGMCAGVELTYQFAVSNVCC